VKCGYTSPRTFYQESGKTLSSAQKSERTFPMFPFDYNTDIRCLPKDATSQRHTTTSGVDQGSAPFNYYLGTLSIQLR